MPCFALTHVENMQMPRYKRLTVCHVAGSRGFCSVIMHCASFDLARAVICNGLTLEIVNSAATFELGNVEREETSSQRVIHIHFT
jgi:hypothetical protein